MKQTIKTEVEWTVERDHLETGTVCSGVTSSLKVNNRYFLTDHSTKELPPAVAAVVADQLKPLADNEFWHPEHGRVKVIGLRKREPGYDDVFDYMCVSSIGGFELDRAKVLATEDPNKIDGWCRAVQIAERMSAPKPPEWTCGKWGEDEPDCVKVTGPVGTHWLSSEEQVDAMLHVSCPEAICKQARREILEHSAPKKPSEWINAKALEVSRRDGRITYESARFTALLEYLDKDAAK